MWDAAGLVGWLVAVFFLWVGVTTAAALSGNTRYMLSMLHEVAEREAEQGGQIKTSTAQLQQGVP